MIHSNEVMQQYLVWLAIMCFFASFMLGKKQGGLNDLKQEMQVRYFW